MAASATLRQTWPCCEFGLRILCASSMTTSGQVFFSAPSLASSLFLARVDRLVLPIGGDISDFVFSKFRMVTRLVVGRERAIVRLHCGTAPLGQITSTSCSG